MRTTLGATQTHHPHLTRGSWSPRDPNWPSSQEAELGLKPRTVKCSSRPSVPQDSFTGCFLLPTASHMTLDGSWNSGVLVPYLSAEAKELRDLQAASQKPHSRMLCSPSNPRQQEAAWPPSQQALLSPML